jgi:phosphoribosylformylglycinamidine (FGAM) synthase-like enzyme
LLFGESASRIVVTCEPSDRDRLFALAARAKVPAKAIGCVVGRRLAIGSWIDAPVEDLSRAWRTAFDVKLNTV